MPVTYTLAFTIFLTSIAGFYSRGGSLLWRLSLIPYRIKHHGEIHRFITDALVHSSWAHLIVNLWVLLLFGEMVEIFFAKRLGFLKGELAFLALFLTGNIISGIPAYIKHRNNPSYMAVGASGGVSAILFSAISLNPTMPLTILPFFFVSLPAIVLGILYLIFEFIQSRTGTDNVAHDAHIWGAITGFFYTIALFPDETIKQLIIPLI